MVHLSCGQCRKIQQFSGEPPRCEICGWQVGPLFKEKPFDGGEVAPKFQRKQNPINKLLAPVGPAVEKIIKFVVFGSLSLVGLLLLVYWLKPEKEKLAEQYGVSADKVFVEPKPHGCDFDDAPLGNKHCHFEKEVSPVRDCERCPVTSVYVDWKKVLE